MNKSCGNCKWLSGVYRQPNAGFSICDKYDYRTTVQMHAKTCQGFKRIKFHKLKEIPML